MHEGEEIVYNNERSYTDGADAVSKAEELGAGRGIRLLGLQELEDSTDNQEERIDMKCAAADLVVIKAYKLGWPAVPYDRRSD
jgi:hypothetical protein